MLTSLEGIGPMDLRYPKPHGMPELRSTIANYYNDYYGSSIDSDNVMVFAGGKPALWAVLLFLKRDVTVRIGQAEYPAYYAMLDRL